MQGDVFMSAAGGLEDLGYSCTRGRNHGDMRAKIEKKNAKWRTKPFGARESLLTSTAAVE